MRIGIVGTGVVGSEVARVSARRPGVDSVWLLSGSPKRQREIAEELGKKIGGEFIVEPPPRMSNPFARSPLTVEVLAECGPDVVVVCVPDDEQLGIVATCIEAGISVVSLADSRDTVKALMDLDAGASAVGATVVVGAAASPGLSVVLARHAASLYDFVESISVGVTGTAGPDCRARRAHALKAECMEWRDGAWVHYVGSPGSELLWFPDPLGSIDCGRGDFSETMLLQRDFPDASRISTKAGRVQRQARWWSRASAEPSGLRVEVEGYRRAQSDEDDGRVPGRSDSVSPPVTEPELSSTVYGLVAPSQLSSALLASLAAVLAAGRAQGGVVLVADLVAVSDVFAELALESIHPMVYEGGD